MAVTLPVPHFSKHQKKDHARILRGTLPPEILKRLAAEAKAEEAKIAQAAADKARAVAEAEAEYKRTLLERLKREQQERFLKNAEKFS